MTSYVTFNEHGATPCHWCGSNDRRRGSPNFFVCLHCGHTEAISANNAAKRVIESLKCVVEQ